MAAPAKKPAAKGAAAKPKKAGYAVRAVYDVSGDTIKRARKSCPKCGDGVFMAEHKDRSTCGKCGYTEFKK